MEKVFGALIKMYRKLYTGFKAFGENVRPYKLLAPLRGLLLIIYKAVLMN